MDNNVFISGIKINEIKKTNQNGYQQMSISFFDKDGKESSFLTSIMTTEAMQKYEQNLSPKNRSKPPQINPAVTTSQASIFKLLAISTAGLSRDQNEAAIITPAEKLSSASITFFLIVLKKKTIAAPSIVTPQVNKEANKACVIGDNEVKKLYIK